MKTKILRLTAGVILLSAHLAFSTTTIDATSKYVYGANIGWMDWRGDIGNGAVIGEYVCSGYIYSANVGWINLGNGSPANGIHYQNAAAGDFGVNQDGLGNLTGYAYSANIGWINFEQTYGKPRVDLFTGKLSGSVYSANCGWISLSNAAAYVQTVAIQPGADTDSDGIADAWELLHFGNLTTANASSDFDGDGVSDAGEYLAGTDPQNAGDYLHITSITHGVSTPTYTTLQWTAVPTRYYIIQERPSLSAGTWTDYLNLPFAGWSNVGFDDYNPTNEFFRVIAYRPLMP
ncbi:MAG TPA: thrombospondin type 3 repeat-containing protein [Verrucomicrobiae bacterium]|nr:thrombospondin type 3 repeat-containing protein [Verrucomicrobiae bacterium]